jgi:hypothetical protein
LGWKTPPYTGPEEEDEELLPPGKLLLAIVVAVVAVWVWDASIARETPLLDVNALDRPPHFTG